MKATLHSCSPQNWETSLAVNGSSVCAGLQDQARRAQRMQSSINIISTVQAVVDSLSKDTANKLKSFRNIKYFSKSRILYSNYLATHGQYSNSYKEICLLVKNKAPEL